MVELEIVVHPIMIREDTENREEIMELFDRIHELTGRVEKRPVSHPHGCVSLSHLDMFAQAHGYSANDAVLLWSILLRDWIGSQTPRRADHHDQTLLIRHISGEMRDTFLRRAQNSEEKQSLLSQPGFWVIHVGSLCTSANAIIADDSEGLSPKLKQLLQEWTASLSKTSVSK